MKKIILCSFLCIFLFKAKGQNDEIVIGKVVTIKSKVLSENREVWIHLPSGITNGVYDKKSYPVLYLLDGGSHFHSVVGIVQRMGLGKICPEMIIVGITNTNRTRDLTPTQANPDGRFVNEGMASNSGGGEKFMSFIKNELIPYVDSNYLTQPYRMFIGHSLGGLTVMNTLLNQPDLFNSYVAIDPSMWWDNGKLLNEIKAASFDENNKSKALFLGIANTMEEGMDTLSVQNDTTYETKHIRAILELNTFYNKDIENQLSFNGKYYPEDDHGSVPLIAEYDALRFIFDFYRFKLGLKDLLNPKINVVIKIEAHYKKVSNLFGIEMKPDESYMNELGYEFISMNQFKKAEQVFNLNVKNYPNSFNVFDSFGDLYLAIGNKEKAIESFKKSVALNKDSCSKEKLIELEKK
jgi:predicted alpha/beta superfamily hydrolase